MKGNYAQPWRLSVLLMCLNFPLGCVSTSSPPARAIYYPITSGFHKTLPARDARILVWGAQSVSGPATTWLQTHGWTVIPPQSIRRRLASEEQEKLTYTYHDADAVLHRATSVEAELVLFADYKISAEAVSSVIGNFQPTYTLDVTIRGVNVITREVEWKGNAHYPPQPLNPPHGLAQLTCQALATAWGLRPAGQLNIPSQLMCTAGQTEPVLSP